jgi:hypothetical protein
VLVPSAKPEVEPANVVTTPAGVILRIRLLNVSATYTLPCASVARPSGLLNIALAPVPSVEPALEVPAKVVTTPPGVIFLIRLLLVSAT